MLATLFKSAVCMYTYVVSFEDGALMWAKTVENGKQMRNQKTRLLFIVCFDS